jgi:hypothetical protein
MHSASFAEWMLSLVTTSERASSTVGDLMEDVPARGWRWFWLSVIRTALSIIWCTFAEAPLSMIAFAVGGWFVFMLITVILSLGAELFVILCWGLTFFFTHHTGLELLANLLKIRLDWPLAPPGLLHWTEAFVVFIAAPLQMGSFTSRYWRGREITAWLVICLVWPIMITYIPFVARSNRISLTMIPMIQAAMLLGILRERRLRLT